MEVTWPVLSMQIALSPAGRSPSPIMPERVWVGEVNGWGCLLHLFDTLTEEGGVRVRGQGAAFTDQIALFIMGR